MAAGVALPDVTAARDPGDPERSVCFGAPRTAGAVAHLGRRLSAVGWIDTRGGCAHGFMDIIRRLAI